MQYGGAVFYRCYVTIKSYVVYILQMCKKCVYCTLKFQILEDYYWPVPTFSPIFSPFVQQSVSRSKKNVRISVVLFFFLQRPLFFANSTCLRVSLVCMYAQVRVSHTVGAAASKHSCHAHPYCTQSHAPYSHILPLYTRVPVCPSVKLTHCSLYSCAGMVYLHHHVDGILPWTKL